MSSAVADLQVVIENFIALAKQPALLDVGEEPFPLIAGRWSASEWHGRLVLQAWDDHRNLVRKVIGVSDRRRDRIALTTERFPKLLVEMQLCDLAAPDGRDLERRSSRIAFRERLRLMLAREFPTWTLEDLSGEPNLEQSLSPAYVRAFLRSGSMGMAVLAAPPGCADPAGAVTFGLIWLDYLRRRERKFSIRKLLLYVEPHARSAAALRTGLLNSNVVQCDLYVYDERDRTGLVDGADDGNIDSMLPPCFRPRMPNMEMPRLPYMPGVDCIEQSDGAVSVRVRGLEIGSWGAASPGKSGEGQLRCGIGRKRRCSAETLSALARNVVRVRVADPEDRQHPLFLQSPESWMEAQVSAHPEVVDASLLPRPIYGQVPIFGAPDRGVVDLLGVDHSGRLVVIELKADADLQLPFQALDYWTRVCRHLKAGDFERLGYFAGITLRREPPRILLVAPALEFHSTAETVLGFLRPEIEIVRIGLSADWRAELKVMFRLPGATAPGY